MDTGGTPGTGLTVARPFFEGWALPFLRRAFPALAERAAAGVFRGSQALGADDALSRDHGWGPQFDLLLTDADLAAHGGRLRDALQAHAPWEWAGHRLRGEARHGISVDSIDRFFVRWVGWATPPADPRVWLRGVPGYAGLPGMERRVREYELYLLRHGHVLHDPLGAFSARRAAFARYPEAVWLQRVWDELFDAWHYGQYNFLDRLVRRDEPVAARIALGHFAEAAMRLCLLLEHDYSPYWKWLPFEFRKRPAAAELDPLLVALVGSGAGPEAAPVVGRICDILHRRLDAAGLAAADLTPHPHPLYCDQAALRRRIDQDLAMLESDRIEQQAAAGGGEAPA